MRAPGSRSRRGAKADIPSVNAPIDAARAGALPIPPVRFVAEGALGTNAFGAWDGRTIYLDRSSVGDSARRSLHGDRWEATWEPDGTGEEDRDDGRPAETERHNGIFGKP